jgi:DHA1 family tetracycline resistance protein-like MFS transporter
MTNDLKRKLAIIFGFTFIDLLGYSLILPLLPYIAGRFNAGPVQVGLLLTANALSQMIAAPLIGRLSDRWGRRPMLLISITGTIIAFLIFAFSQSLAMLFISRIVDGFLGGNTALARAYITDVTDSQTRSKGLGLIGAAFGLGFIIGPFAGGQLSRYGYMLPGLVAAGLSFLNLIAVLIWLPESLTSEQRRNNRNNPYTAFTFKRLLGAIRQPCVGSLLQIGLWFSLSFTLFQVNFVLVAKEQLNLDVQTTSLLLSLVGVLAVITQGVIIGWLTARFNERKLLFTSTIVLSFSLLAWAFVPNVVILALVMVPTAISAGITSVLSASLLTKSIHREEVGGTLGLAQAQQSFAGVVAPFAGGQLIQYIGTPAVGVVGALLMAIAVVIEKRVLLSGPELEGPCAWEEGAV